MSRIAAVLRLAWAPVAVATVSIAQAQGQVCAVAAQAGDYLKPVGGVLRRTERSELLAEQAQKAVVLLGERHDSAEDHRWQLHMLAQLHALRPRLALGLEMFPRRLQSVLDRWVLGELSEAEFLRQSEWEKVWGFEPGPYLGLFHYARMNRLPMLALNVDRQVVSTVARQGLAALPESQRQGVGSPAPPVEAYRKLLLKAYEAHLPGAGAAPASLEAEAAFERFVEAQIFWDRAMAERLVAYHRSNPQVLLVAVMGSGHVRFGFGVAHQLAALGLAPTGLLHTLEHSEEDCASLRAGSGDAAYVLEKAATAP